MERNNFSATHNVTAHAKMTYGNNVKVKIKNDRSKLMQHSRSQILDMEKRGIVMNETPRPPNLLLQEKVDERLAKRSFTG